MKKNPKLDLGQELVSIIMPAFNSQETISEAIESVLQQTYKHWELLIVDDCSLDNTSEIINKYIKVNPRIVYIPNQKNLGPSFSRNAGLSVAKGRWVAFLDSDDIWLENKLESSIRFAEEYSAPLVFTGFRRFLHKSLDCGIYQSVPFTIDYKKLLKNNIIATSTVVIDKKSVPEIQMRDYYYDDFVCWLEILKSHKLAYGLDEDLMRYRVVKNSVSRNKLKSAFKVWAIYRKSEKLSLFKSLLTFFSYAHSGLKKYSTF